MKNADPHLLPVARTHVGLGSVFRIVIPYLAFASLWIFFSDRLLSTLAPDVQTFSRYSIMKGMLFVLVSGLLLYILLRIEHRVRSRMSEALLEANRRFQQALNSSRHILYRMNVRLGRYDYVSPVMAEFLGCSMDELLDQGWKVIQRHIHPDDWQLMQQQIETTRRDRLPTLRLDYRLRDRDGNYHWFSDSTTIIYGEDGQISAFVGAAYDITDRKLLEQDRDQLLQSEQTARAKAEAASRAKDELLAVVSHELRTPLTPIVVGAELLLGTQTLDAESHEIAERILDNAMQEARLVSDLLDTTWINVGKLQLNVETVDVHALIRRRVEDLQSAAETQKLKLILQMDAEQATVSGDPVRLRQVFSNLINNAIKFTPEGGIIFIRTHNQAAGRLTVEVKDTGIGIEPDVLQRLFRPFEQADRSSTRRYGGMGLGLYLSRSLVELQGGSLTAESNGLKQGAVFRVQLPVAKTPQASTLPLPVSDGHPTILLVEDNADSLQLLNELIKKMGIRKILTASNGAQAVELAMQHQPNVLISDIALPDRTGWELMRELSARMPIRGIAISGFGTDEDLPPVGRRALKRTWSNPSTSPSCGHC